ncbi:TIGR02186 family protein [Cypionkella sp.]|uniref:TIGR02186 family protein n=1 Tax=Cypionkella sp. TaxID=2811411 RepID=UPI003752AAAC
MRRLWALALALASLPQLTCAEEQIVTGLSQNRVEITANYDGSNILIYGAVKRTAPPPEGGRLEVIVTVEGPAQPLVLRRKEKVAGIWINQSAVTISSAPSFYAVATTGPFADILSHTDDLRYRISLPQVIRAIGISAEAADSPEFVEALKRIRMNEDRYHIAIGRVQLLQETLFRADVELPANLSDGNYKVRLFILRGGEVIDHQDRYIGVRKAGIERDLFNLAHEQPLLYGVISLLLAAVAGWAASAGFRYMRR